MRRMRVIAMAALTAVLTAAALGYSGYTPAAQTRFDAAALIKGYGTYLQMRQASPTAAVPWQYLGPTNVSGRATDVAIADKDGRRTIIVGYATSGVWKSDDNGTTWTAIFEHMPSTSIGDVAVAPSNPDIVWVGTGEANLFRASLAGVGIYKSTDGGRTFQHMGLAETHTIARIVVHPANPDIVYVAATGHGWTDNPERGVFRTADGGKTWQKIYFKSNRTGANDLVMDPSNPNVLYASLWQRIRRKWSDPRVEPGYREGGIIKSADGGRTWTDASNGLPAPEFRGRIGIDISQSNPNILYAFVDNYEIGRAPQPNERDAYGRPIANARIKAAEIYRSDDSGASWRKVNTDDLINHSGTYGWVFGQIRVDPKNPDRVYTLGLGLNRSEDGGRTRTALRGMHGDHHGLWIDPADPTKLYNANDGGFYLSEDDGRTWKFARSAAGAQFYNVALDNSTPIWAYGSIQDHGSFRGKVILVNVTGSWCPNCHDEAPFLVELYRDYNRKGLEIVALGFEEADQLKNPVRPRAFVKQFGIPFPFLLMGEPEDAPATLGQAENLNAFPTNFVIGRDGRVRAVHAGFASVATGTVHAESKTAMKAEIERLLAEGPQTR